ncbi:MAG TPA: cytochrome c3 family protein [Bdellovibrionota bacterium]|nr:cytochrome c3 family protein [Bdellovibrionota bacterium]
MKKVVSICFTLLFFVVISCQSTQVKQADKKQELKVQELKVIEQPAFHAQKLKGATYVGVSTCTTCHEKQAQHFKMALHARVEVSGVENTHGTACEMCHGPGSLHVEGGGDKTKILNLKKDNQSCFNCHAEKKVEFKLKNHHPVLEGKMQCTDCHNPHAPDAKPWTAVSESGMNEACFKCHAEKRGPFAFEHEAISSSCIMCHNPHGSIHSKMLVQNDKNLCLKCHVQPNYPVIGGRNHSNYANQGTCWSAGCHTAVHGSNFDDHLRY